ncbi:MAG: tRNA glutamyl-Q(34) synthetase GluQRS [Maricaulis sp.]|nr:tRNA glutamyl-Q(34) synthetase GluQRS [Maricaulis sp.]
MDAPKPFITRFAPSPSGHLHLGHAFSAWTAWSAARKACGTMLLRIEDIDTTRCKPEFERAIFEDLAWWGLDWPTPVRRQSEHFDAYAGVVEKLRTMGVVYRCFKTRREVLEEIARAPHQPGEGPDHAVYRGPAKQMPASEEADHLADGLSFAWRLSLDRCREYLGARYETLCFVDAERGEIAATPDQHGDVILARKDVGTSYHIAVVHDDALQGVTHVVRGEDLLEQTSIHILLQTLLELPQPHYRHHRLLLDKDGKRFAKRNKAATLRDMRANGMSANDVLALFGSDTA